MKNPTVESLNAMFDEKLQHLFVSHLDRGVFSVDGEKWSYIMRECEICSNIHLKALIEISEGFNYLFYLRASGSCIEFRAFPFI